MSPFRYALCFPHVAGLGAAACVLGAVLAVHGWRGGLAAAGAAVYAVRGAFRKLQAKFHGGDLVPSKVVTTSPYLVASFTDLSTGGGWSPAIRITRQSLAWMTGGRPGPSARLVAVAHYFGNVRSPAWDTFEPTVINRGCNDATQIARALASIREEEWAHLDKGLAQIAKMEPGLYRLGVGGSFSFGKNR